MKVREINSNMNKMGVSRCANIISILVGISFSVGVAVGLSYVFFLNDVRYMPNKLIDS